MKSISNKLDITWLVHVSSQIARFMGPTWGPPGSCRPQMGPMLAPWTLLSGMTTKVNCDIITSVAHQIITSLPDHKQTEWDMVNVWKSSFLLSFMCSSCRVRNRIRYVLLFMHSLKGYFGKPLSEHRNNLPLQPLLYVLMGLYWITISIIFINILGMALTQGSFASLTKFTADICYFIIWFWIGWQSIRIKLIKNVVN